MWLIYAADLVYVLFGAIAIIPGLIPYVATRLFKRERVFNTFEWVIVAIIVVAAIAAAWGLARGTLSL